MDPRRNRLSQRSGMTLLEMMMSASLLAVVVGAVAFAVVPVVHSESYMSTEMRLYSEGRKALQIIANDLRQATPDAIGAIDYPGFFTPYDPAAFVIPAVPAGADFTAFNFLPPGMLNPVHQAVAGDADFGPTTQIIFKIPATDAGIATAEVDGNGVSTDQTTGEIEWVGNDMTYCLVQNPASTLNELRRYTDYGNAAWTYRTVAVNVERVLFECNDGSGQAWDSATLSAGGAEVRVTIWFRAPDGQTSVPVRASVTTTVNMRN